MLTDRQITKFQTLYYNHFGEKINKEEALEKGTRLVSLMSVLLSNKTNNYEKRTKNN